MVPNLPFKKKLRRTYCKNGCNENRNFCTPQMAGAVFGKILGARNKIYLGLISMLQGSQKVLDEILSNRAWKDRARWHRQFQLILQNLAESAMLASTALLGPIYQDFMQYFFKFFEACPRWALLMVSKILSKSVSAYCASVCTKIYKGKSDVTQKKLFQCFQYLKNSHNLYSVL